MPVGLNAFPLKLHWQCRGFLHRGDMAILSYFVHMHIMIRELPDVVKGFLQYFPVTFISPLRERRVQPEKPPDESRFKNQIAHGIIAHFGRFLPVNALFYYEQFPLDLRVYTDYQDPLLMVCSNQR
jgi:hypothetical protein